MPKLAVLPDVELDRYARLEDGFHVNSSMLHVPLHAGTHIDAPCHIVPGGATIDRVPETAFVGPGVVSSVRRRPGDPITVEDILGGGPEPQPDDILLIDTGWGALFESPEYHDHPSLDPSVGDWAVERRLKLVGLDCLTPDLPLSRREDPPDLKLHKTLLGAGILIAENLTRLEAVAGERVDVHCFPIIVRGGDAAHARIFVEPRSAARPG